MVNEMLIQRVTPAELARQLNTRPQDDVTRIVNLGHSTKIDTISAALRTMGKDFDISVREAYPVAPS